MHEGEAHCVSDRHSNSDEWRNRYDAHRKSKNTKVWENSWSRSGGNRRQQKNELKFNTEGHATADQLANLGADTDKAGGAEWPASDLQKVF